MMANIPPHYAEKYKKPKSEKYKDLGERYRATYTPEQRVKYVETYAPFAAQYTSKQLLDMMTDSRMSKRAQDNFRTYYRKVGKLTTKMKMFICYNLWPDLIK